MDRTEMCPHPLSRQDAGALIGIVSILEAELALGQLDAELAESLRTRLTREGLVGAGVSDGLRVSLAELAQRLHHAWGAGT